MATNPRFPEEPERSGGVEPEPEWKGSRPFPWGLVGAIIVILCAIGIAWYFFH